MNQSYLEQLQAHAKGRIKRDGSAATDPQQRAELLADAREQRLLEMMNDAVFYGTLKAHLVLVMIGGIAWAILLQLAAR